VRGGAEGGVGEIACKEGGHPGDDRQFAEVGLRLLLLLPLFLLLYLFLCHVCVNIRIVVDFLVLLYER
jgi:hypothetical protein